MKWIGAHKDALAACAIILAATGFLFHPLFTGAAGYFEWDVPEQYWPDLVLLCDSLHDGALPTWNPYDRAGYPVHADPQATLYHPLHHAMCLAAGPSPGLGWATARVPIGFLFAGLFALAWLRRLGASWAAATVGAVVLEAAPFMRHNWELNLTFALAHLPLVLWAAERLATERRARDGALLGLALGLTAWAGSPPALHLVVLYALPYLAMRVTTELRAHGRSLARPVAISLGVTSVVAAPMIALVVVPGLDLAERSVQAGRDFASIAAEALAPGDLVALVWPMPGNHLYVGIVALVLAGVALARSSGPQSLRIFFAVTAALAVILALGPHTPVFRAAYELVPSVRLFRLPYRYEAWLGPSFAALAALGLDAAARLHPRLARYASLRGALALSVLALVDASRALPPDRHARGGAPPATPTVDARLLRAVPRTESRFRFMDEFAMSCRAGTRLHRREMRGYQDPLSLAEHAAVLGALRRTPALAPQFNVRYALQGPHYLHGWDRHFLPPPDELLARVPGAHLVARGPGDRTVIELESVLPLAYFVPDDEVERAPSREAALARVEALAPAAIAILDGRRTRGSPATGRAVPRPHPIATARVLGYGRDSLSVAIDAPGPGVLVVNEAFHPDWRATVDGDPAPTLRANALVRAIPIDPGTHVVRMRFEPPHTPLLRALSLGAILLALALVALGARRPRRPTA